jgi:protein transport protein SEC61 subunit gamma-like protein
VISRYIPRDLINNAATQNSSIMTEKEGFNDILIQPLHQFAKDSIHLVKKCTKPDRKEFTQIACATGIGFLIMGFIGFFVKLVHIPINNILVGN